MPFIAADTSRGLDSCLYLENPHLASRAMSWGSTIFTDSVGICHCCSGFCELEYELLKPQEGSRTWDN